MAALLVGELHADLAAAGQLADDPAVVAIAGVVGGVAHHHAGAVPCAHRPPGAQHPAQDPAGIAFGVEACAGAGISVDRIAVDPGIGFGKTDTHNLQLLSSAAMLHGTGASVMVGASRKSFIGRIFNDIPSEERLPGSLAAAMMAVSQGAQLLRVHDVAETRQTLAVMGRGLAET